MNVVQLSQQPFAIIRWYRNILLLRGIPAPEQRFGRHGIDLPMHLRQDLKAPIEDQFCLRVAFFQLADYRDQPRFLPGFFRRRLGKEMVGIERIQKESAIARFPQRFDDALREEHRPRGLRLIQHDTAPVAVLLQLPGSGNRLQIGALGRNFTHRHISEERSPGVGMQFGVGNVQRLHYDHIESMQLVPRQIRPVEHGDTRLRGKRQCGHQHQHMKNGPSTPGKV